jgi:hypothetical protein
VGIQAAPAEQAMPEGAQGNVMEHLNWGYLQLGLFALAFGGLQVWWISSTLRKRDLARPMSEGEFRRSLERIWAKRT